MSYLLKDQWQLWAQTWGLTHVAEKGWFRRTERVLGKRKGMLFRVMWGPDEDPGLHVCVRFPTAGDTQRLRDSLIADPTLDALPGKGSARSKMEVQTTTAKVVRIGGQPEFQLGGNFLLWRRKFAFKVPNATQIQEWVDALVEAVGRATPGFSGKCETCATGQAAEYVVVDDLPMLICTTCQQRLRLEGEIAERQYEMLEARYVNGAVLATGAALLGATAWAAIAAATQHIFSIAAIGIGALVAFAYKHGATRVDPLGKGIAGTLTLASVITGQIGLYTWWIMQRFPQLGFDIRVGWQAYQLNWSKTPGEEIVPMIFALVGAWFATQALQKPKLATTVQSAQGQGAPEQRKAA